MITVFASVSAIRTICPDRPDCIRTFLENFQDLDVFASGRSDGKNSSIWTFWKQSGRFKAMVRQHADLLYGPYSGFVGILLGNSSHTRRNVHRTCGNAVLHALWTILRLLPLQFGIIRRKYQGLIYHAYQGSSYREIRIYWEPGLWFSFKKKAKIVKNPKNSSSGKML